MAHRRGFDKGNGLVQQLERAQHDELLRRAVDKAKPVVDNRVPAAMAQLPPIGKQDAVKKQAAVDAAIADKMMIFNIAKEMSRPHSLSQLDRKGPTSLNLDKRRRELRRIDSENGRMLRRLDGVKSSYQAKDHKKSYAKTRQHAAIAMSKQELPSNFPVFRGRRSDQSRQSSTPTAQDGDDACYEPVVERQEPNQLPVIVPPGHGVARSRPPQPPRRSATPDAGGLPPVPRDRGMSQQPPQKSAPSRARSQPPLPPRDTASDACSPPAVASPEPTKARGSPSPVRSSFGKGSPGRAKSMSPAPLTKGSPGAIVFPAGTGGIVLSPGAIKDLSSQRLREMVASPLRSNGQTPLASSKVVSPTPVPQHSPTTDTADSAVPMSAPRDELVTNQLQGSSLSSASSRPPVGITAASENSPIPEAVPDSARGSGGYPEQSAASANLDAGAQPPLGRGATPTRTPGAASSSRRPVGASTPPRSPGGASESSSRRPVGIAGSGTPLAMSSPNEPATASKSPAAASSRAASGAGQPEQLQPSPKVTTPGQSAADVALTSPDAGANQRKPPSAMLQSSVFPIHAVAEKGTTRSTLQEGSTNSGSRSAMSPARGSSFGASPEKDTAGPISPAAASVSAGEGDAAGGTPSDAARASGIAESRTRQADNASANVAASSSTASPVNGTQSPAAVRADAASPSGAPVGITTSAAASPDKEENLDKSSSDTYGEEEFDDYDDDDFDEASEDAGEESVASASGSEDAPAVRAPPGDALASSDASSRPVSAHSAASRPKSAGSARSRPDSAGSAASPKSARSASESSVDVPCELQGTIRSVHDSDSEDE